MKNARNVGWPHARMFVHTCGCGYLNMCAFLTACLQTLIPEGVATSEGVGGSIICEGYWSTSLVQLLHREYIPPDVMIF